MNRHGVAPWGTRCKFASQAWKKVDGFHQPSTPDSGSKFADVTESAKAPPIEVVQQIVDLAVRAPSAENTQPWKLDWDGEQLRVFHDRSRQMASDVDAMLDLTGIGALIESVVLAASRQSLRADLTFPESESQWPGNFLKEIASIRFEDNAAEDPLAALLEFRCTTRRMDRLRRLTERQKESLQAAAAGFPGVQVDWVPDSQIPDIAALIGLGNRMRFEHVPFHDEFYSNLLFTAKDARCRRDGLDVATLQLPPGVSSVMWAMKSWRCCRIANLLGFSRAVEKQAAREVTHSGAVGLVTVQDSTTNALANGGRALQRVWLEAARLGLAFHPTASLPVFLAHLAHTESNTLLPMHTTNAEHLRNVFFDCFPGLRMRRLQLVFRVGYGDPPSVRTLRRPVSLRYLGASKIAV